MADAYDGNDSFEWDLEKARSNAIKHQVTFEEAMSVFADPLSVTVPDPDHSEIEERLIILGFSDRHRLLVVIYTERENGLRLISARAANPDERRKYEGYNYYGY